MNNDKLHIKNPGFETPKGYFDTLESQLLHKIALDASVSNKKPFKVPENYFEELDARLQNHPNLLKKQSKIISLYRNKTFRYVASIAALLLIFISIFNFQQTKTLETNTITQIENYIENGFLDLSTIDYEMLFTDEMLENTSIITTLDEEELFDYLSYEIDEFYLTNN